MSCNPIHSDSENKLLAVVMCGGKSLRMGTDKGLLKTGAKTWAELAVDKLEVLHTSVYISINDSQFDEYKELFTLDQLVFDEVEVPGPLCGLLSVHSKFPDYDLLIMACDMQDIKEETLSNLKSIYEDKSGEHDFMVFSNQGELEPLLGVYTAEGLAKIFKLFLARKLDRFSMKHVLEIGNTYITELSSAQYEEFRNYNEKSDIGS